VQGYGNSVRLVDRNALGTPTVHRSHRKPGSSGQFAQVGIVNDLKCVVKRKSRCSHDLFSLVMSALVAYPKSCQARLLGGVKGNASALAPVPGALGDGP
jgi:hypothetical protein